MKFTITKKEMMSALSKVAGIVDNKGLIPILGNVLIRTVGADRVSICATDMEVSATITAASENEAEGGVTIPALPLMGIVSSVTNNIDISTSQHRATIKSGDGKFTLGTLPVEEYPTLPEPDGGNAFEITSKELLKKVGEVSQNILLGDTVPFKNALFLKSNGNGLKLITSDGFRLSIASSSVRTPEFTTLIPGKTVNQLNKIFSEAEKVKISTSENLIQFAADNLKLTSKLVAHQYPDMEKFIPDDWANSYKVDSDELAEAIKRVSLAQRGNSSRVYFYLGDGVLRLECNESGNEFSDKINAEHECEPFRRCLNASYVQSILENIDGPVLVRSNEKEDSINLMTSANGHSDTLWAVMGMKM